MLVLTRKTGQEIRIGNDIIVNVVAVKGGRVRIGITAPEDCSIVREELRDALSDHVRHECELELTHS